jgi:magnesium transporter
VFVVLRMLQLVECAPDNTSAGGVLDAEQVSLLLYDRVLITFQEKPGDVWKPIRERLQKDNVRIRKSGTGYLLYALLDAMVDHCFPVLEQYGDLLEELELITLEKPTPEVLHRIHAVKRELSLLRRIVWPMREVVDQLYREEDGRMGEVTKPYLRDVYEHTIQIVEIIESYREMVSGLTDLYMSAVSNRMNEIMKVLTIMSSVFIPLTFVAGVYGMNFAYMLELTQRWAYPAIWGVFILLTVGMIFFFKRRGWLGGNR